MLKLNASYPKKVPADAQYSSQSYLASVEVEPAILIMAAVLVIAARSACLCVHADRRTRPTCFGLILHSSQVGRGVLTEPKEP
jgi:hypothetical protein